MQQLPKVKTVGIICKHDKPEAWDAAGELVAWLGERGVARTCEPGRGDAGGFAGHSQG